MKMGSKLFIGAIEETYSASWHIRRAVGSTSPEGLRLVFRFHMGV
jgi:hypothetical protein